ncbi:MAG: hypothetical protein HQL88_03715 [Magnetococcales bacterium]|nr:hypothetical protein [Magnetococcales bacterium]
MAKNGGEVVDAATVFAKEKEISDLHLDDKQIIGLGLSGGGIRSASFNLGLLQALHVSGLMDKIHYLSTVSGGGYIGAAYSWFKHRDGRQGFPFTLPDALPQDPKRLRIDSMRGRGDFLAPTVGLNAWALSAAWLRGILANLAVVLPAIFLIFYSVATLGNQLHTAWSSPAPSSNLQYVEQAVQWLESLARFPTCGTPCSLVTLDAADHLVACKGSPCPPAAPPDNRPHYGADYVLLFGMALGALFIVNAFLYALLSHLKWSVTVRRWTQIGSGRLLWWSLICLLVGSLPLADRVIVHWTAQANMAALLGIATTAAGWFTRKKSNEGQGWRSLAIGIGLAVFSYLILVYCYRAFQWMEQQDAFVFILFVSLFLFLAVGLCADVNRISMHRFYRDRLREAFLPCCTDTADACKALEKQSDLFGIAELANQRPYHIVNTTMTTLTSKKPKLAGRGGENFVFSPLFCGSQATGFRPTREFADKQFSLLTAFTISGAAVDPNSGVTHFGPLAFLMTLLNARLGYWCVNPKNEAQTESRPRWLAYIWREMLQSRLDEEQAHLHLADGGHFENLAAYELIHRRCDLIIIGDAGADKDNTFDTLGNLVEKVRVDFGTEITINTKPMEPKDKEKDKLCEEPYLIGTIRYPKIDDKNTEKMGILIYVNTCLFPDLPACVMTYQRMNKDFPEQTTADQFFDEAQFEAYRELGFRAGLRMAGALLGHVVNKSLPDSLQQDKDHEDRYRELLDSLNDLVGKVATVKKYLGVA